LPQSKLIALLESLKARYPTASADELSDRFMEELRSDEELHKTVLEEVFRLMASGLERTWPKNE
jgi:bacterioferritin (cytochrome b1)